MAQSESLDSCDKAYAMIDSRWRAAYHNLSKENNRMENEKPDNFKVTTASSPNPKTSLKRFAWPLITLALLIALVVCVLIWQPWQPRVKAGERTISVTGDATLKAEPDEYVFNPNYDFRSADKKTALDQLTAKNDEIVTKLKALGVADKQIANSSSGYGNGIYSPVQEDSGGFTYTLQLTITIDDKPLAQKVQDYLLSTNPTGSVSPEANFSTAKQKQLQDQARAQAETDAKSKASQSAENLGFKVDRVKSVEDNGFDNFGGCPGGLCAGVQDSANNLSVTKSLSLQPGQNDLSYSVKVTYYIH